MNAATPRPIIDKLHEALVKILQFPDARQRLAAEGADIVGNAPEEFAAFIRAETTKWARVVKVSGMRAD